ncbi:hypothetical protein [Halomonas cupida]|nr:hypothetical protein [Halomonas cupida]
MWCAGLTSPSCPLSMPFQYNQGISLALSHQARRDAWVPSFS